MHKPESLRVKKMRRILWDFEIKTNQLILARSPNLMLIFLKISSYLVEFAVSAHQRENINEREFSNLAREVKIVTVILIIVDALVMFSKILVNSLQE